MSNRPQRKNSDPSNTSTVGRISSLEFFAIAVFFIFCLLYALSTCNNPSEGQDNKESNISFVDSVVVDSIEAKNTEKPSIELLDSTQNVRNLYVNIDSLRMRKDPRINADIVEYLTFGQELKDLEERSFNERLKINKTETAIAPWIKVRTKKGNTGWVYGAYLLFYKPIKSKDIANTESSHQD